MSKYYSPAVYGPVVSRRLGYSLGINLLPLHRKVCSFDCIYCECGKSGDSLVRLSSNTRFLNPSTLRKEILRCFRWHCEVGTRIDYVSFVGNGEPTLYPWFEEAVDIVVELRDMYFPLTPIAIFTNGTMIYKANVVRSLDKVDRRFLKLDAADRGTYQLINKSFVKQSFNDLILNLSKVQNPEISTAIVDGRVRNVESVKSERFVRVIGQIAPLRIFLYPVDRPSAYSNVVTVSKSTLYEIKDHLKGTLSSPIIVLLPKKNRPSWFDEAYAGLVDMVPPAVYSTEQEVDNAKGFLSPNRKCYSGVRE